MDTVAPRMKQAGLMVLTVLVLFIVFSPAVAGAQEPIASQIEQMFLGPGEHVSSTAELLFGIVLPFLLVFAIIHYAMRNIWPDNEKEATIVSIVLALFPIPTGAYQFIGDLLIASNNLVVKAQAPSVAFQGTILGPVMNALSTTEARIALSLGFGAILALVISMFGTGQEKREFKKHEIVAVVVLTAAFWLAIGGWAGGPNGGANSLSQLTSLGGFAVILGIGGLLLYTHMEKKGGLSGAVTGFLGLVIIGWGLQKLPSDQFGPLQHFGQMITQGAMWIVGAIIFILFGVFVLIFHLKNK